MIYHLERFDCKQSLAVVICLLFISQSSFVETSSQVTSENLDSYSIEAMGVNLKWVFPTFSSIGTSPIPFDLEGDGNLEIIFGSQDGCLYCVDKDGNELWCYFADDVISSTPAVADLNKDGFLDIVFGSYDNNIYCITPVIEDDYAMVYTNWIYTTGGEVSTTPTIIDIDMDNELEVLIGSGDSILYCLGSNGSLEWSYKTAGAFYFGSALGISDIDSDGHLEVFAGTDALYCLSSSGELVWKATQVSQVSFSSPTISDLNGDGKLEIIIGSVNNSIYCLNSTGHTNWRYFTTDSIFSSPAIYDLFGDSNKEIIFGSNDGMIHCLFHNGTINWTFSTGESIWSSPSIADLDNDGFYEILIGSNNYDFYCLQNNGNMLWKYTLLAPARTSSCVIDLDNDNVSEIIFGSGYYDSNLYCLELTGVTQSGDSPWFCYRGSFSNTGWQDKDSDLLDDLSEIYYNTEVNNSDTDLDGFADGIEVLASTDPTDIDKFPPREDLIYTPPEEIFFGGSTYPEDFTPFLESFSVFSVLIGLFSLSTMAALIIKRKKKK